MNNVTTFRSALLMGGAFVALMALGPASGAAAAPAASDQAESTTVGEIVVTAQRRSENLQDVPIAVTAVTAERAQSFGLVRMTDIATVTPGASFTTNAGFFAPYIRGIGVGYVSAGLESPVAIYEDGAYLTRTLTVNEIVNNFDIGSIQVLRGPQGTLYGRNATGGVIIVNSADPTSRHEARVRGELGNLDHRQIDAMVNLPLREDLALRVSGGFRHDGGFVHDLTTGQELAESQSYNVRAKLRWQPEHADIILGGEYYNTRDNTAASNSLGRADSTCYACVLSPGIVAPSHGFYETQAATLLEPVQTQFYGSTLKMTFNLGPLDVSTITSFRRQITINSGQDVDLTPLPLLEYDVPASGGTSYTEDLQASSKLIGPFNFIAGFSFLHDKGYFQPAFVGLAFGGLNLAAAPSFRDTATTRSYAAFLEGYYNLTRTLKVTVGGRYTYEDRTATGAANAALAAAFGAPGPYSFTMGTIEHAFTPRFVLAWDNGQTDIYYSFTRGFKAGGFPGPFAAPVDPVQPEKIASHEIGIKQSMLDGRMHLNGAAFYFKNTNQQTQTLDLNSGGTVTSNAGALQNYGIELEAQFVPVQALHLSASAAWQHPRYDPYHNASLVCFDPRGLSNPTAPGATLYPCSIDLTGRPPPHAPEWSGSFTANYEFDIGTWAASLSGLASYRSSIDFQPGAGGPLLYDRDGGLFLVNASGYVSPPGRNVRIGFYANNLFNKQHYSNKQTSQPYALYYQAGMPRAYGVRVEYTF